MDLSNYPNSRSKIQFYHVALVGSGRLGLHGLRVPTMGAAERVYGVTFFDYLDKYGLDYIVEVEQTQCWRGFRALTGVFNLFIQLTCLPLEPA